MKRLVIVGTGGHARVVADAARLSGHWGEIAFVDDRQIEAGANWASPRLGRISDLAEGAVSCDAVVVAIGANGARARIGALLEPLGLATIVHPAAVVADSARIGPGSMVLAGAIVAPGAELGPHAIVNHGACVDHDVRAGEALHVSPRAALAGHVRLGARCWIGIGAVVINGITLGDDVTVGAGAAVVRDVAAGCTVVGVPARRRERGG